MQYVEKNWYNTKYKISKKLKNIFQFLRFSMIYNRKKSCKNVECKVNLLREFKGEKFNRI
jgi:hypothetical protein